MYAEELMRQKGFFSPKEELAQLAKQIWRAYRIVLDVGLHTGDVSVEEAEKILRDKVFLTAGNAKKEIYRYSSREPMQAITYMVGRFQIEELKENYKAILGSAFSEAEFHKRFLSYGPVPPTEIAPVMLDEARREAVAAQKKVN